MTELLDLSIPTLMTACKGNVNALPSFMVHDNAAWVTQSVQLDSKNRIHLRRSTFLAVVCKQVPVRAGVWHNLNTQEFHIDLQPHHLQGSAGMDATSGHKHSRAITRVDSEGRNPGDDDYGETALQSKRLTQSDLDAARVEVGGQFRGVGSAALSSDRSE